MESTFHKNQQLAKSLVEATIIDDDFDPLSTFQSRRGMKLNEIKQMDENVKGYIKLEGVFSQWNVHEDKDTGEDIENENYVDYETVIKEASFEFKNSEKVAVIGKVGCGKTSLFLTILKELCIVKGKLQVHSS